MSNKLAWKIVAVTISSFILIAIAPTPLAAEQPLENFDYPYCCQNDQFEGGRGRYSRKYDLSQIETFDGEVVSVDAYTSRRGVSQGVHLLVNTGKETVEVHLGPSWYLEDLDFVITPEDKIAIKGSRINIDGEPTIIASEIKKGSESLMLRDENGFPLWSSWRR